MTESSAPLPEAEIDLEIAEVADVSVKRRRMSWWAIVRFCMALVLVVSVVISMTRYGNIKFTRQAEYINVARAIVKGHGFANPFPEQTGPTAWVAPVLPYVLAELLSYGEGNWRIVNDAMNWAHIGTLIITGVLVVILGWQNSRRLGPVVIAALFLIVGISHYYNTFHESTDGWLAMLGLDFVLAGLCWGKPYLSWQRAVIWGIVGGCVALASGPIPGIAWGTTAVAQGLSRRAWSRLALTLLAAALTLAPWTIRNYLIFERFIFVKSNAAFEAYQTQFLQRSGMLRVFNGHPYGSGNLSGREYRKLGEAAFLDKKRDEFLRSVADDPEKYLDRCIDRFMGAAITYEPMYPGTDPRWIFQLSEYVHPLAFVGFVILILRGVAGGMAPAKWSALGVYAFYLLPYIAISFYDRYGAPLIGVKTLLIAWALDEVLNGFIWLVRKAIGQRPK